MAAAADRETIRRIKLIWKVGDNFPVKFDAGSIAEARPELNEELADVTLPVCVLTVSRHGMRIEVDDEDWGQFDLQLSFMRLFLIAQRADASLQLPEAAGGANAAAAARLGCTAS